MNAKKNDLHPVAPSVPDVGEAPENPTESSEDTQDVQIEGSGPTMDPSPDIPEKPADSVGAQMELDNDLTGARAEIENLKDQLLRARAEVENMRRRTAREIGDIRKFAVGKFAADLLPLVDGLEQALKAAGGSGAEGVELCLKLFINTLSKHGIEHIVAMGETFDPKLHEAMSTVPAPDADPDSVVEVLQEGYTIHGRLLRPARVLVAKGK